MAIPGALSLLAAVQPPPRFIGDVGVYFLIKKDVVVYVGQSIDVRGRVKEQEQLRRHPTRKHRRCFDRAVWMPVEECDLDRYEATFIWYLAPKYNTSLPCKPDHDLATRLGLSRPCQPDIDAFHARRKSAYRGPAAKRHRADVSRTA